MEIPVVEKVLKANDQVAADNRDRFAEEQIAVANLMASPGAGKTSLILATLEALPAGVRSGVIEGDVASSLDADRIGETGVPVVQVNTGGGCHLEASMVRSAFDHLPLDELELLFIENVGNLICPSAFDLGADLSVVVGSVPEGSDKPYKYPGMFTDADAVVMNKTDMLDSSGFDLERYRDGVRMLNESAPVLPLSCRTGEGVERWVSWLLGRAAPRIGREAAVPGGDGRAATAR